MFNNLKEMGIGGMGGRGGGKKKEITVIAAFESFNNMLSPSLRQRMDGKKGEILF